jgi:hypothetical protein
MKSTVHWNAVLALLFGGAGMLIGGVVMVCVAVFLCLLFASLGMLMMGGIALACAGGCGLRIAAAAAAVDPDRYLLVLLVPSRKAQRWNMRSELQHLVIERR